MAELGKLEDLKAFLQGKLGLRVTMDDLKSANPDVVQKIYLAFLRCFNFRVENFHQLPFGLKVPDPEMYQDSMPFAALAACLDKIIKMSGATITIYLCDVLDPKPKKFKIILTHLCQIFLFWESRMNLFEPIKARYEDRKRMEQKLEEDSDELKCQINQLQHDINDTEERLENANEVERKAEEVTAAKDSYVNQKNLLKNVAEEMSNRHAAIVQEQKNLPGEIESLKSQLRQPLVDIEKEVQEWEVKASKWEEKCNSLRQKGLESDCIHLERLVVKLEEITEIGRQVSAEAKNLLNCNKNLPSIQKDIETTKIEIMSTEKSISEKRERFDMLKQKNEKQLWRRQCQIEEKNAILAGKEGAFVADETSTELRQLNETERKLRQDNSLQEEKLTKIQNDFTASFNSLKNSFMETHRKEMKEYENILKNLEGFYE